MGLHYTVTLSNQQDGAWEWDYTTLSHLEIIHV